MREFTLENARNLIGKMRIRYGKKFTDQWAAVEPEELEQAMVEDLSGLSIEQLKTGYDRMRHEPWPPSIPEFRNWCMQGSTWLTEYEAWVQALAYESSGRTISASVFVIQALKELRLAFDEINPKFESQAKAYRDMYVRIITDAKTKGLNQSFTAPVKCLEAPEENHKGVPCPPELMARLGLINRMGRVA